MAELFGARQRLLQSFVQRDGARVVPHIRGSTEAVALLAGASDGPSLPPDLQLRVCTRRDVEAMAVARPQCATVAMLLRQLRTMEYCECAMGLEFPDGEVHTHVLTVRREAVA